MKSEITAEMRRRTEVSGTEMTALEADRTFDLVVGAIKTVVHRDGTARLPGLGTFTKKFQLGRQARNPRTGEPVSVPGRDVIKFKATKPAQG